MKPLFIPLKAEYYDAFAAGTKTEEIRLYGKRWNERTCPVGRAVILSRGYGRKHRMRGIITYFAPVRYEHLSEQFKATVRAVYGDKKQNIAFIGIEGLRPL